MHQEGYHNVPLVNVCIGYTSFCIRDVQLYFYRFLQFFFALSNDQNMFHKYEENIIDRTLIGLFIIFNIKIRLKKY